MIAVVIAVVIAVAVVIERSHPLDAVGVYPINHRITAGDEANVYPPTSGPMSGDEEEEVNLQKPLERSGDTSAPSVVFELFHVDVEPWNTRHLVGHIDWVTYWVTYWSHILVTYDGRKKTSELKRSRAHLLF